VRGTGHSQGSEQQQRCERTGRLMHHWRCFPSVRKVCSGAHGASTACGYGATSFVRSARVGCFSDTPTERCRNVLVRSPPKLRPRSVSGPNFVEQETDHGVTVRARIGRPYRDPAMSSAAAGRCRGAGKAPCC
jgi:hypothetical protein